MCRAMTIILFACVIWAYWVNDRLICVTRSVQRANGTSIERYAARFGSWNITGLSLLTFVICLVHEGDCLSLVDALSRGSIARSEQMGRIVATGVCLSIFLNERPVVRSKHWWCNFDSTGKECFPRCWNLRPENLKESDKLIRRFHQMRWHDNKKQICINKQR